MNRVLSVIKRILPSYRGRYKPGVPSILDRKEKDKLKAGYFENQIRNSLVLAPTKKPDFRYTIFGRAFQDLGLIGEIRQMLCVGCRNAFEIDYFESLGIDSVTGADLFSFDPRIKVMDMHDLQFADGSFDVLYAGDSFEHALDPVAAAGEFLRVVKPGGYLALAVPANYQTDETDRIPFSDFDDLYSFFSEGLGEVVFKESRIDEEGKPAALRTIFRTVDHGSMEKVMSEN